jgi:exodeoxyribonuclease VII large subunit
MQELIFTPSDFIAIANQTLEVAFGFTHIEGELSNFRISKNRWVYFDIKDENAKVSCFSTVYALPGPLEDGMVVKISGQPRLHPQFGFSITVQSIVPSGEGALKKAFDLLKARLTTEGLFDESRKRYLPYPPKKIALISSLESAAYADFVKILAVRWPYVSIDLYDVQVQGEIAPMQLVNAIVAANSSVNTVDVLVMTRGGGSADDLVAFNDERVVRAIAASRIPTLVAIGHEIDESLCELAADMRASTPSNAAELMVPDRSAELEQLRHLEARLQNNIKGLVTLERQQLQQQHMAFAQKLMAVQQRETQQVAAKKQLLSAYNPHQVLQRGYAVIRLHNKLISHASTVHKDDILDMQLQDGLITAIVNNITLNNKE